MRPRGKVFGSGRDLGLPGAQLLIPRALHFHEARCLVWLQQVLSVRSLTTSVHVRSCSVAVKFYTNSILIVPSEMGIPLKEKMILKSLMQTHNRHSSLKFNFIFVITRS